MKTKNLIFSALLVLSLSQTSKAQWQKTNFSEDGKIDCIVSSGSNIFVVVKGDYPGVFKSTDNGNKWSKVNTYSGSTHMFVQTIAINAKNIFAGTYEDGVFLSTNNGKTWTAVNNGLPEKTIVNSMIVNGENIFIGTQRGIFISSNNGSSWISANTGLPSNITINSLAASGANIFAGTQQGIYLSTNNGGNWNAVNNGLPNKINGSETWVQSLAIIGSNIFAGAFEDGVFLSKDNGSTWTAVNTGLPKESTPLTHKSSTAIIPIIYMLANGSEIFAIAAHKSTYSYGGGIFKSTNNGANWTAVNNGLPDGISVNSLAIIGTNIFCGITNNKGIWICPLSSLPK
ncbi:MAG: hypothetical protein HY840_09970 [Bacteroidetes bacterium]|nr:hypothetical protein [Bacteroidota bacterium]